MREVRLTIDGKDIQLTDEDVKALYREYHKHKNPFERKLNERYFSISPTGRTCSYDDTDSGLDRELYGNYNYFRNKEFANQIALHQLLYRKLLKFAYDNACEDITEWDGENPHWCIYYDTSCKEFDTTWQDLVQYSQVYFSTKGDAERAIKEIVEPFMKEHPNFVW